jgi:hypothetical protein
MPTGLEGDRKGSQKRIGGEALILRPHSLPLLDIGENKPLKTAILAAFFVFSVKLFESEALSNFG